MALKHLKIKRWLTEENKFCVICEDFAPKRMVNDHDHTTGFYRGRICHSCNIVLGMARDKPRTLINAIKYLRYWDKRNQESPDIAELLQRHRDKRRA